MVLFKANKYTPRWIVFLIDLVISLVSIFLAFITRYSFQMPDEIWKSFAYVIPFVIGVRSFTFFLFKSYAGLVRFTSAKDTERVILVVTTGSLIFVLGNFVSYRFVNGTFIIPFSIVVIDLLATSFIMVSSRLIIKSLYHEIVNPSKLRSNVVIFGADEFGAITKRTIDRDAGIGKKVVAFVDIDKNRIGKKLEDVNIHHINELKGLCQKYDVNNLIITRENIDPTLKDELVKICLDNNVKVKRIPESSKWINGDLSYNQIKSIKIEDLLERDPINLDNKSIRKELIDKVVLVTGAAGSIGSEIVRQIAKYHPRQIILLDQAESPLYDVELELLEKMHFHDFKVELGDITNFKRIESIFNTYKPSIIYHAAAYKHVPMMEMNPPEAITTNIQGTKNIADLAHKYEAEKFVMVSTDKAVNPTNIMGASKRIAEIYIQSLNNESNTGFVTTRFGNVLGSNGSVIPRFKKQIETGGPVTITHPDVTRYFMTIPEACQLVLEASAMGKGGEIFLFDMGKSVRISDLARRMIKLSGMEVGRDIQITYTGLRPGEKLHEELLTSEENTIPTHHEKIMKARVRYHDNAIVKDQIAVLMDLLRSENKFVIVKAMKGIVPEFKSKNSVFEKLDIENYAHGSN